MHAGAWTRRAPRSGCAEVCLCAPRRKRSQAPLPQPQGLTWTFTLADMAETMAERGLARVACEMKGLENSCFQASIVFGILQSCNSF